MRNQNAKRRGKESNQWRIHNSGYAVKTAPKGGSPNCPAWEANGQGRAGLKQSGGNGTTAALADWSHKGRNRFLPQLGSRFL
ncbi:hypothetical protein J6590_004356 [Homalodisca vitripennis]|nr:hypothetical protein J6590_004356 [Homalodisca vitripennis]